MVEKMKKKLTVEGIMKYSLICLGLFLMLLGLYRVLKGIL